MSETESDRKDQTGICQKKSETDDVKKYKPGKRDGKCQKPESQKMKKKICWFSAEPPRLNRSLKF